MIKTLRLTWLMTTTDYTDYTALVLEYIPLDEETVQSVQSVVEENNINDLTSNPSLSLK